jgi:hypothetical protein
LVIRVQHQSFVAGDRATPPGKNEKMPGSGMPGTVRLNNGLAAFVIGVLFPKAGSFHCAIGKTPSFKANLPNGGEV